MPEGRGDPTKERKRGRERRQREREWGCHGLVCWGIKGIWWLAGDGKEEMSGLGSLMKRARLVGVYVQPIWIHVTNANPIFAKWNK